MPLLVRKSDGSVVPFNPELAIGSMVVAGISPEIATNTVETARTILERENVEVVPTATWTLLSDEIRRGDLVAAVDLVRTLSIEDVPTPGLSLSQPLAHTQPPAAKLTLRMAPEPHLNLRTFLRPEHSGYAALITSPAAFEPALTPFYPAVGFDELNIPLGFGEANFGGLYQVQFMAPGARAPIPALSLPLVYIPPLFGIEPALQQLLEKIELLEDTIDDLAELRQQAAANHPWGPALILYNFLERWSERLDRIPADVWLAAALFIICQDHAVAKLSMRQLRHLLDALLFVIELEIITLELKEDRSAKEDAILNALRAAQARLQSLLVDWDETAAQNAGVTIVRKFKQWMNDHARDALEWLAGGFGLFSILRLIPREVLYAAAHFAACQNEYLNDLDTKDQRRLLELFSLQLQLEISALHRIEDRTPQQEATLQALLRAKARVDVALEGWDDNAAPQAARALLQRLKLELGADAIAALVSRLARFAVEHADDIPIPRFVVVQLVKFIVRRILSDVVARKVLGPIDVGLALIDLGQALMVLSDVNDIDDLIDRARWQKAELLVLIPALRFPETGSVGRDALVLPPHWAKRVVEVCINAIIRCGSKEGDDFDWSQCDLKVRRIGDSGDGEERICIPSNNFRPGEGGSVEVPYEVILESDCMEGADICYVSVIVTVTWSDGTKTNRRLMIRAKDFRSQ